MGESPLALLTLARFREFAREPSAIFWTFGFPLLLTVALGLAFRNERPPVVSVGVGAAGEATGRGLTREQVAAALGSSGFSLRRFSDEADEALALGRGQVLVAVDVMPGGQLTYRFDARRPEARAARQLVDEALQRAAGRVEALATVDRAADSPGSRYVDWLVPGLVGMQLMSGSMWGISFVIVQARQRKLLKRLVATPMRRGDYLASFVLYRLAFVLLELPILLGFARLAFGMPVHGAPSLILGLSILGAAAFAGLGLLCASRAKNSETANGLVNLVQLPMFLLSGVFFASSRFPDWAQLPIRLLPLTALNDGLRAVINEGAGAGSILGPALVLAVWGGLSWLLALRLFRWV